MVFIIGVMQQHCDCVLLCIIFRHCKDMDKYLKAKSFDSFFISPYFLYLAYYKLIIGALCVAIFVMCCVRAHFCLKKNIFVYLIDI